MVGIIKKLEIARKEMAKELARLAADYVHRPIGWGETPEGNAQLHSIDELKCMLAEIDAIIVDLAKLDPSNEDIDRIEISKLYDNE